MENSKKLDSKASAFVDLSHTIYEGLVTYSGFPGPVVCDFFSREDSWKSFEDGTKMIVGKIEMIGNTGTYIDFPFHLYEDGKDSAEVGVEHLVDLEGIVVRADYRETLAIGVEYFMSKEINDKAVLVHTGWDRYWNSDSYHKNHPYLTKDAAEYLRQSGAKLVGIDSVNIDNKHSKSRPVHSILLKSEIFIVEHLCGLEKLPDEGFSFSALPPKFKGIGTFPVRAMAKLNLC